MKPEIKARWVEALRSGRYKQGFGWLRQSHISGSEEDQYCCLGVLCELAVEDGIITAERTGSYTIYDHRESTLLPENVIWWAGLENLNDSQAVRKTGRHTSLIDLNDRGKSFTYIAKYIEREF